MHASSPASVEAGCERPLTIAEILSERATLRPNAVAYRFLGESERSEVVVNYAALAQRAHAVGAWLVAAGCAGRPVLLIFPAGIDFPVALFGTFYAGAIAVPAVSPRMSDAASPLEGIVADADAVLILTTRELAPRIAKAAERSTGMRWPRIATIDAIAASDADRWIPPRRRPGPAILQYTSGSTSSPKGVEVSDSNILHNLSLIARATGTTSASIGVSWLPHYHDMGLIGGVLLPIHSGFPVTLMSPASFLRRPMRWLQAISDCGATISAAPNFAYQICARKAGAEPPALDLSAWQVALCGSEPIRADTMRLFATTFGPHGFRESALFPSYGLAEATLMVSGGPQGQPPSCLEGAACVDRGVSEHEADEDDSHRQLVASGRIPDGVHVDIVDPVQRTRCAPGRVGEIWVAGRSVASGYWNKPAESAAVFGAVIAATNEGPYLRTGDLGFMRDGLLYVAGRMSDVIIVRGVNHYPQDVERTVEVAMATERANACAAFSVAVDGEERLVVVVEADRHVTNDYGRLFNAIRRSVAEHHGLEIHAVTLIQRGTMPLTSSGKLQRRRCRKAFLDCTLMEVASWRAQADCDLDLSGDLPNRIMQLPPEARQSFVEGVVVREVARAMRLEPPDVDALQPIVSFGLDSLRAAGLRNQLERLLDVDFDVIELIDNTTIADVCVRAIARIEARNAGAGTPAAADERVAELTRRIDELSDEEVAAALKQEWFLLNEEQTDERVVSSGAGTLA